MAKAKFDKVDLKNIQVSEKDGNVFITGTNKKEEEVTVNVSEKLKSAVGLENINFKINQRKSGTAPARKKMVKYQCPKCEKKIQSEIEGLQAECAECGVLFEQQ